MRSLAELEVYHSRPVAPTRRVSLGVRHLPVDPPPGHGGLLLAGIVGTYVGAMDVDLIEDLERLTVQLERRSRVPQPQLRHRLQEDKIGLTRSVHRLVRSGEGVRLDHDEAKGSPSQHVLGAVYAAAELGYQARSEVFSLIRKGLLWRGGADERLVSFLCDVSAADWALAGVDGADPLAWALRVLGFVPNGEPPPADQVRQRFRQLLRVAHPDHGGASDAAAQRIAELTEARRILLA